MTRQTEIITAILVSAALSFASGLWTGRKFPAHHYEHLIQGTENASNSIYLFDTATGKVCSAWKVFQDEADKYASDNHKPQDPWQEAANEAAADKYASDNRKPQDPWQEALNEAAAKLRASQEPDQVSRVFAEMNQKDAAARSAISYVPPCGRE